MVTELGFPGGRRLVAALDEAVEQDDPDARAEAIKDRLCGLIRGQALALPATFRTPLPDRYARRLLYRSPERGYTVLAMAWGPAQGTPLHDHAGIWCVEGVVEGEMEVVQYDLTEQEGERYRFARQGAIRAGVGSAGSLIPPFEYHTLANRNEREVSVTIHVYGGEMDRCSVFEPLAGGWYLRRERRLAFDN